MTMTNEELAEAVARLTTINVVRGKDIDDMQSIIRQLWAEREGMEKEITEQCRIIGAGGERELALLAKVEEHRREIERVVADYDWLRKTLNKRIGRFDEATGTLTLVQCENCEANRAAMVKAKEAIESLRGTIDPDGIGAWSSDSKQAKSAMQALAALESVGV